MAVWAEDPAKNPRLEFNRMPLPGSADERGRATLQRVPRHGHVLRDSHSPRMRGVVFRHLTRSWACDLEG